VSTREVRSVFIEFNGKRKLTSPPSGVTTCIEFVTNGLFTHPETMRLSSGPMSTPIWAKPVSG